MEFHKVLCLLYRIAQRFSLERLDPFREPAKQNSLPDLPHDVKKIANIVQRGQGGEQNFTGLKQMPQVRAAKRPAGIAAAGRVQRPFIFQIARVLDHHFAL